MAATQKDIKRAYTNLALHYHPDRSRSPSANIMMMQINEAYATLSDYDKRRDYDKFILGQPISQEPKVNPKQTSYQSATSPSSGVGYVFIVIVLGILFIVIFGLLINAIISNNNHNSTHNIPFVTALNQDITIFGDVSQNIVLSNDTDYLHHSFYKIRIITPPLHGTLAFNTESVTYTPFSNYIGSDNFTYLIKNYLTGSISNIGTICIIVNPQLGQQSNSTYQ